MFFVGPDMGQTQETEFRVIHIEDPTEYDEPTIHLQDIRLAKPVMVEQASEEYSNELTETIQELGVGNKVFARIHSVDYVGEEGVASDGLWYFDDVDIRTTSRFTFIDDPDTVPSTFLDLCTSVDQANQGLLRQSITSDGEEIGVATAFPVSHAPDAWTEIRDGFRRFEPAIDDTLGPDATPPYEALFLHVNDGQHIITLHFNRLNTRIARAIRG